MVFIDYISPFPFFRLFCLDFLDCFCCCAFWLCSLYPFSFRIFCSLEVKVHVVRSVLQFHLPSRVAQLTSKLEIERQEWFQFHLCSSLEMRDEWFWCLPSHVLECCWHANKLQMSNGGKLNETFVLTFSSQVVSLGGGLELQISFYCTLSTVKSVKWVTVTSRLI